MVIVEVKVEQRENFHLLEYRDILKKSGVARTCLVIVTRYAENFSEWNINHIGEQPLRPARWYQVADWLFELENTTADPVTKYVLNQFWRFLDGRGMTMDRVRESFVAGIQDLRNLMRMLNEAIVSCGGKRLGRGGAVEAIGHYFRKNQVKYWCGVYYENPGSLLLQVEVLEDPSKVRRAEELAFTELKGSPTWRETRRDLTSSPYEFFSQSKEEQIAIVEEFPKDKTLF